MIKKKNIVIINIIGLLEIKLKLKKMKGNLYY